MIHFNLEQNHLISTFCITLQENNLALGIKSDIFYKSFQIILQTKHFLNAKYLLNNMM